MCSPSAGPGPAAAPGVRDSFTGTPAGVYRRAPRLGEHTDEVLAGLDQEGT